MELGISSNNMGNSTRYNRNICNSSTNANSTARAATPRVYSQVIGAAALTSATREALGIVVAAHVSPLAERSLAKENGTGITELSDNVSITRYSAAEKRQATGRGFEVVFCSDIVLDLKYSFTVLYSMLTFHAVRVKILFVHLC